MVVCSKCGHQNNKLPISDTQLIIGVVTKLLPGSYSGFISDEIYFPASSVQSEEPLNVGDMVVVETNRKPENGKGTPFKYKALKISKVDLDLTKSATTKSRRNITAPSKSAESQLSNRKISHLPEIIESREETTNSFLECDDDDDVDSESLFEFLSQFRRNPRAKQKPQTYIPIPQSTQKCHRCHDSSHEAEACTLTAREVKQRILANEGPDSLARYKREQERIAKRKKRENEARKEWEFRSGQFKCTTGNQNHTTSKPVQVRQTVEAANLETPSIPKPVNETLKSAKSRENPELNLDDHDHDDNRKVLEFDLSKIKQEVLDDFGTWKIHDDDNNDNKELQNSGQEVTKDGTQNCKNCGAESHETINCVYATRELHHMQRKLTEQQMLHDHGPEALRNYINGRNRARKLNLKTILRRVEQFEVQINRNGPPPISPSLPEKAEDEKEEGEVCEHAYFRPPEGQDPVLKRCIQCLDFSHKVNFCPYRFKEMQTVEILEALKSRREKFRESHGQDMLNLYMHTLAFYFHHEVTRNEKRKIQDMSRTQSPYQENAKRFKKINQISTVDAPQTHIAPTHYQSTEMRDPYQNYDYCLNAYKLPPPQFQYIAPPPGVFIIRK